MKKSMICVIAVLSIAASVQAAVDPTKPMITHRGNVKVAAPKTMKTAQTADSNEVKLDKFVVTGTVLKGK